MKRALPWLCLLVAAGVVSGPAQALDGGEGYTATALFSAADVVANVVYDPGSGAVPWSDLDEFALGSWQSTGSGTGAMETREAGVDSGGSVYFLVSGRDSTELSPLYTGLILRDGSSFRNLAQEELEFSAPGMANSCGSFLRGVTVSPATKGRLTEGHPVITRYVRSSVGGATTFELVSVDPGTSPATETRVHSWPAGVHPDGVVAIDDSGVLYVLGGGLLDGSGSSLDGTIRKLVWNGAAGSYDESSLTSLDAGTSITLGGDGAVYAFARGAEWGRLKATIDIYRVDASSGAYAVHASVRSSGTWFHGWARDSEGDFWIALTDGKNDFGYVVEVVAGSTLTTRSARDRIAEWTGPRTLFRGIAAGPDGDLYVLEEGGSPLDDPVARRLNDRLYRLAPDEESGKPGKGGGKK
jgi:hypothetical protein